MTSPISSDEERFNSWVASQNSPLKKRSCECVCHSRKLTPELLERTDRQFEKIEKIVANLNSITIDLQKVVKVINDPWNNPSDGKRWLDENDPKSYRK